MGKGKITRVPKRDITKIYVDSALSFIKRNKEVPFYVNVFPGDVHDPFKPTEEAISEYRTIAKDEEEAKFFAVLKETDDQIGRLIKGLDDMNLMENTIIIMSSDNGPTDWPHYYKNGGSPPSSQGNLKGRKWSLYEGGIRVPLIVQWKDHMPRNSTDSITVGAVMDLFPTILNFSGIQYKNIAPQLDGMALNDAFYGTPQRRATPMFWYFPNRPRPGNPDFVTPKLAMRYDNWKFLVHENGTEPQLYNLNKDPLERKNIAEKYPEKVQKFTQITLDWYAENVVFVE